MYALLEVLRKNNFKNMFDFAVFGATGRIE